MKSANIKPLKSCPMCKSENVFATYEENARYRYECRDCGQYFEFNAPSQLAADVIFNHIIDHPTEKVCTGERCPMQVGYDVKNCKNKDCIYRTETEKGGVE